MAACVSSDEGLRALVEGGDLEAAHLGSFASTSTTKPADLLRWHVQGKAPTHRDRQKLEAVTRIKARLPELSKPYPFDVGPTGYIEIKKTASFTYGRAEDALGRNVFLLGTQVAFQRKIEEDEYVWKNWAARDGVYAPLDDLSGIVGVIEDWGVAFRNRLDHQQTTQAVEDREEVSISLSGDCVPPSGDCVPPSGDCVPPSGDRVPPSGDCVPPSGAATTTWLGVRFRRASATRADPPLE